MLIVSPTNLEKFATHRLRQAVIELLIFAGRVISQLVSKIHRRYTKFTRELYSACQRLDKHFVGIIYHCRVTIQN